MKTNSIIREYFSELQSVIENIDHQSITNGIELIKAAINRKSSIFMCGNGGSAVTASHFYTDWQKMYFLATGETLRCECLSDNIGIITAYANDISYNEIYSKQLAAMSRKGDILIIISGSGNSKNIIEVLKTAKNLNIESIALVGFDGGQAATLADHTVHIPSYDMQLCEDVHLSIGHIVMKSICSEEVICEK